MPFTLLQCWTYETATKSTVLFFVGGAWKGGEGGQQEQQLFSPVYRTGRTQLRNKVCELVRLGVLWVLCPPHGVHMSQIQWQLHCEVDSVAKGWNAQSLAPTSGDSRCCF